jgi:hypothetical protein
MKTMQAMKKAKQVSAGRRAWTTRAKQAAAPAAPKAMKASQSCPLFKQNVGFVLKHM